MSAWLDLPAFKARTVMPPEDVDRLEVQYAGFVVQQCTSYQAWIESRLRKRYAIPFATPVPEIALIGLVALVTLACYMRRGWNPSSAENQSILDADTRARDEIKEAADSKDGLFDLPLRNDTGASGVSAGGPLGYSETSPYV